MSEGPQPDLSRLWGIVQRAVRDPELRSRPGGVTQNIWSAYQQAYLSAGQAPPRLGLQQVNRLVATASAQARAERALGASLETYQRTGLDQGIVAAHIGPDIDSRTGAAAQAQPLYRIRFETRVMVEGELVSRYLTWTPELALPGSVSGLLAALEEAGAAAGEDYGEEFQGLGDYFSIARL